ncbi:Uncharacterized protein TCM_006219 [Theobroma cacao]|uniref:TF-B3 domain-containing protein n=1 Tax=Theobroma cacao TaxID=3641 RepID=A0A061E4C4_THECC|nr:Uncharacterized protein TCM_006219 [Theobroma cacao]
MPQATKIFSKSLTDTDIKKRLAIPAKILPSLPDFNGSHAVTIHLMYGTRTWPIVCSVRKTGYKKPVFSDGWRNFVICNDFHVGEVLTLYKVQDEEGSFHYRVEVEKLATPSVALSARALSLNHEVDETTGTSRTKISNFQHDQEQLPKADAPVIQEGATMEQADAAANAPVPFVDHVIAKPPGMIFGTAVSDEATKNTSFKPEHETKMKFFGVTMGIGLVEPPLVKAPFDLNASESTVSLNLDLVLGQPNLTKEERDIKAPFDLNGGGSLAVFGTSQATEEACSESTKRLILVLGQRNPHNGAVNLDLTLAQALADTPSTVFAHSKPYISVSVCTWEPKPFQAGYGPINLSLLVRIAKVESPEVYVGNIALRTAGSYQKDLVPLSLPILVVVKLSDSLYPPSTMPQAIQIFSKSLTETDIKKRLVIPANILPSLPYFNGSHAVTIHLMYGTRMWPIVCSVRKTGYKKPVFSGGWRNFVICNDFHVGEELTLYKVQDEAGSFHYRVEVDKLATPSVALSARALSLNHEVNETTVTSPKKFSNFKHQQEQLLKADALVKQEGAIMELADAAADAPVPFVDHVIAKPTGRIFGTGVSGEATSKAHFKPEHETEMEIFGMGEPPSRACYMTKEERDIKAPFDLNESGSLAAFGTSQATGEAYYKSTGRISLDLVLGQPSPYN